MKIPLAIPHRRGWAPQGLVATSFLLGTLALVACGEDENAAENDIVPSVEQPFIAGLPAVDLTQVATGGDAGYRGFACAVTSQGGVKCWGANEKEGIGLGDTDKRSVPTPVPGLGSGVAAVSAGSSHACALTTSGGVKCWGNAGYYYFYEWDGTDTFGNGGIFDGSGDLGLGVGVGDGTTETRLLPTDVEGLSSGVRAVAAGPRHTCALSVDGGVKCWGHNQAGELGDGTNEDRLTPVDVSRDVLTSPASGIFVGLWRSCAITGGGSEVTCWGSDLDETSVTAVEPGAETSWPNQPRLLPVRNHVTRNQFPSAVRTVGVGPGVTCALLENGKVYCWGRVKTGMPLEQLLSLYDKILDVSSTDAGVTVKPSSLSVTPEVAHLRDRFFAASPFWTDTPFEVAGLPSGLTMLAVTRDLDYFAHFTSEDGAVIITAAGGSEQVNWGDLNGLELSAPGTPVPLRQAPPPEDWTPKHLATLSTAALRSERFDGKVTSIDLAGDGRNVGTFCTSVTARNGRKDRTVLCSGAGIQGQLGDGTLGDGIWHFATTRRAVVAVNPADFSAPLQNVDSVSRSSCAIDAAGGLRCWGRRYAVAERMVGLEGKKVTQAVGHCALTTTGRVFCWDDSESSWGRAVDVGLDGVSHLGSSCVLRRTSPVRSALTCSVGYSGPATVGAGVNVDVPTPGLDVVELHASESTDLVRTGTGEWYAVAIDYNGNIRLDSLASLGDDMVEVDGDEFLRCGLSAAGSVRCLKKTSVFDGATGYVTERTDAVDVPGIPVGAHGLSLGGRFRGCLVSGEGDIHCWSVQANTEVEYPSGDIVTTVDTSEATQVVVQPATPLDGFPGQYTSVQARGYPYGTCAVTEDGHVRCAGSNESGALGDRTYIDRTTSEFVYGL